jgi:hypothetical protein
MVRVKSLADRALQLPEGLRIYFRTEAHGTFETAHRAARSFQTSFSSMRAKARRQMERAHSQNDSLIMDTLTQGPYDSLACQKEWLPNGEGFAIWLAPAYALDLFNDVVDAKSGQQLEEYTPDFIRSNAILQFWLKKAQAAKEAHEQMANPLDPEAEAWWFDHEPELATDAYHAQGFDTPSERKMKEDQAKGKQVDLADIPLDQDIFDAPND